MHEIAARDLDAAALSTECPDGEMCESYEDPWRLWSIEAGSLANAWDFAPDSRRRSCWT